MLGDILGELSSSVIEDLFSQSTDRGRVRFNFALSAIAGCSGVDLYDRPQSGSQATMGIWGDDARYAPRNRALVFSAAGLIRLEDNRLESAVSLVLAGLALLWPLSLQFRQG